MQNNLKLNIQNSSLLKSKKILVTGTAGFSLMLNFECLILNGN